MSTTQEYYVRKASETDARGPFALEQLTSLAENNQIDPETYFYDAAAEAWVPISRNPELLAILFPGKKILRVKPKSDSQVKTINTLGGDDQPITVDDMLLAAGGQTAETRDFADPAIAQARAASIGLNVSLAILALNAAAYILPDIDLLLAPALGPILAKPHILLGVINLALAVCVALGAVAVYPFIRFVAMLGLGFSGLIYYLNGDQLPLLCTVGSAVGLYFCTILINIPGVLAVSLLGLAGAGGLAYHTFTH